ncbi:hypothetical protein Tco_0176378 [Tanacetum coccineum]
MLPDDESMVVLRVPRKHNLYTINLNNLSPRGNLACLVAKASVDEKEFILKLSMLLSMLLLLTVVVRYVVPTGKDNFIVSAGRLNMVPASRTILIPGRS